MCIKHRCYQASECHLAVTESKRSKVGAEQTYKTRQFLINHKYFFWISGQNFSYPLKKMSALHLVLWLCDCISCTSYVMSINQSSRRSFSKFKKLTHLIIYLLVSHTPFQTFLITKPLFSGFCGFLLLTTQMWLIHAVIPGWREDKDIFTLTSAMVPNIKRASSD